MEHVKQWLCSPVSIEIEMLNSVGDFDVLQLEHVLVGPYASIYMSHTSRFVLPLNLFLHLDILFMRLFF
jgi:hypothetical protein